ncbi:hypothetical protein GGX14DRAFT_405690 [Mycena pura]|uniref:Uncharacterized protein n=1 Tax=Mycena pura TaxID=153505 RepID=A0AAD6UTF6_9AGAR|nr:hypothetical protein GGX14DRAFT_405690 [Mycena pura]
MPECAPGSCGTQDQTISIFIYESQVWLSARWSLLEPGKSRPHFVGIRHYVAKLGALTLRVAARRLHPFAYVPPLSVPTRPNVLLVVATRVPLRAGKSQHKRIRPFGDTWSSSAGVLIIQQSPRARGIKLLGTPSSGTTVYGTINRTFTVTADAHRNPTVTAKRLHTGIDVNGTVNRTRRVAPTLTGIYGSVGPKVLDMGPLRESVGIRHYVAKLGALTLRVAARRLHPFAYVPPLSVPTRPNVLLVVATRVPLRADAEIVWSCAPMVVQTPEVSKFKTVGPIKQMASDDRRGLTRIIGCIHVVIAIIRSSPRKTHLQF